MAYQYAYNYAVNTTRSVSQLYASEQALLYEARVVADGGTVQNRFAVEQTYRLLYDQGLTGVRRYYSALAGVKLNDLGGGNFGVQTMYDLNNASPVDALQTTAANQPYWGLDSDTGFRVPLYDGSNDFMSVNDLGIFNAQAAGTMIAVAKDLNRTGGDTNHYVAAISVGTGTGSRASLLTRVGGGSNVGCLSRRLDADAVTSRSIASADGYGFLAGLYVWGGNVLELVYNSTTSASTTYPSGAGITSATNSQIFRIGAEDASTFRLNGYIAELPIFRTALSAAQIQSLRTFYKQYYPTLP